MELIVLDPCKARSISADRAYSRDPWRRIVRLHLVQEWESCGRYRNGRYHGAPMIAVIWRRNCWFVGSGQRDTGGGTASSIGAVLRIRARHINEALAMPPSVVYHDSVGWMLGLCLWNASRLAQSGRRLQAELDLQATSFVKATLLTPSTNEHIWTIIARDVNEMICQILIVVHRLTINCFAEQDR